MNEKGYSVEEMRAKWAAEVGRFVMAFGGIEGITYAALRQCPRDPIAQPLVDSNLALTPRIDLLIAIANGRSRPQWGAFAAVLAKIKSLAKKRNLIAHNGVGLDVYVDAEGEYHVQEAIRNAKKRPPKTTRFEDRDRVAFHELVAHREEAEILSKLLHRAYFQLLAEIGREEAEGQQT